VGIMWEGAKHAGQTGVEQLRLSRSSTIVLGDEIRRCIFGCVEVIVQMAWTQEQWLESVVPVRRIALQNSVAKNLPIPRGNFHIHRGKASRTAEDEAIHVAPSETV